jgi:exopolyphosphatase/guanosine-5'-triphosphate,3'-diphosphate pyrophosphatase
VRTSLPAFGPLPARTYARSRASGRPSCLSEAPRTARAWRSGLPYSRSTSGGGSTEFSAGRVGEEPAFCASVNVGSVRLTEQFSSSDSFSNDEFDSALCAIKAEIERVEFSLEYDKLLGLAGTVTTMAALEHVFAGSKEAPDVHGTILTREAVSGIAQRLASLSLAERRALPP